MRDLFLTFMLIINALAINSPDVVQVGRDDSRPYERLLSAGYSVAWDLSLGGLFSGTRTLALSRIPTHTLVPATPRQDGAVVHIVQSGDTIWSISQIYGVNEDVIKGLNNLSSYSIYPGDKLIIVPPFTPTPTAPTPTKTKHPTATSWPTSTSTPIPSRTATFEQPKAILPLARGIIVLILTALIAIGITAAVARLGSKKENRG